jgi:hypothetical protein
MKIEREKLYQELLKRAALMLNQDTDAEVTKHVATFLLLRENLQVRALAGERVDPDDLFKCDEVLKQYLPQGKPLVVQWQLVGATDEAKPDEAAVSGFVECRRCHWKPFDKDRVERCYRCGWHEFMDTQHTPWQPLITSAPTADAPKPAAPVVPPPLPVGEAATRQNPPPPPKQSPKKWVGEGDNAIMPAQDILRDAPSWAKATAWSGSANMFGPMGGGVKRGPPSPGEHGFSDHKPRSG